MIKIAFRNISRNKKRTGLTILSTALGIMGLLFSISYIDGLSAVIEREVIKQTGHIRVTAKDYSMKSRVFDNSSNIPYEILNKSIVDKEVYSIEPIIKFAAYGFVGDKDEKLIGFGIDKTSHFKEYLFEGKFLNKDRMTDIVVGKKIKEKLGLKLGNEITLVVNTQYKSTFAINYRIVGFVNEALLNKSVIINIKAAEYLLDMEGRSSELLITLKKKNKVIEYKNKLLKTLKKENLDIKTYNEIGFASAIDMYEKVKFVLAFLIGILCSIGIFNTMVITVFERKKEIGIIKALGMDERGIKKMIVLEGGVLGFVGTSLGISFGLILIYYFSKRGFYVGNALESVGNNINFGDRLYTKLTLEGVIISFFTGILVSLLAAYIPVNKEVKKQITENLSRK